VPLLVEDSVGGRLYGKAAACVTRLREACIQHGKPGVYNGLLTRLLERFEGDPLHGAFAQKLLVGGAVPISSAEVGAGVEGVVSAQEAAAFAKRGRQGGSGVGGSVGDWVEGCCTIAGALLLIDTASNSTRRTRSSSGTPGGRTGGG